MRAREGRLLVVYFGFTSCPDVCPTTLADFKIALKNMSAIERDKVDFAFVTVDPARDTAEILNSYMGHFIDRYHVVRDEPDAIKEAADAFLASYSVTGTGDDTSVSHTAILYAIDSQGSARIEWPFGTDGKSMASDMTKLLSTMGGTSADR
jgi:cytochrome oxidase Cu insertion factor (SCO1/SenC/PrrC family)